MVVAVEDRGRIQVGIIVRLNSHPQSKSRV